MVTKISIAPMMKVTDRHFRVFLRLFSRRVRLYTEMKVSGAVVHGSGRALRFDECEHPLALQVAGCDSGELAACVRLAYGAGFDEINLNVGCPSARVQGGRFGACLMAEPVLVARCVAAMNDAIGGAIPVTVKTRIGIDAHDSYEYLADFIGTVGDAGGCEHFIIHARKALLRGLNPKQNRQIPALNYERVYRLKRDFPALAFTINGGITTLAEARAHLRFVDGVMIGREAQRHPWFLHTVDSVVFGAADSPKTRAEIVTEYRQYAAQQFAAGAPLRHLLRPLLGLYYGQPGGRVWRRHLSTASGGVAAIDEALRLVTAAQKVADECHLPAAFSRYESATTPAMAALPA